MSIILQQQHTNAEKEKQCDNRTLFFFLMRYHYETKQNYRQHYGIVYICDHPVYSRCTLYTIDDKGLAVIQQRYIPETKYTYWNEIDPDLQDDIYLNPGFKSYFHKKAAPPVNDIYPTVTVRQLMWALRMKPLPKQIWETVFDSRILLPLL